MCALLALAFLAATGIVIWAGIEIVARGKAGLLLSVAYGAIFCVAAIGTFFTTFRYEYFSNENTRVYGWPVPGIIFQREDANSPWLDFVGPTLLLAYPMNLVIFMFLPSVVFIGLAFWRRRGDLTGRTRG